MANRVLSSANPCSANQGPDADSFQAFDDGFDVGWRQAVQNQKLTDAGDRNALVLGDRGQSRDLVSAKLLHPKPDLGDDRADFLGG